MNEVILKYRPRTIWGLTDIANTLEIDRQVQRYIGNIQWLLLKWETRTKDIQMPSVSDFYGQFLKSSENDPNESAEDIIDNLIAKYKTAE